MFFSRAFEPEFGFTLRERKSYTLDQIQIDSLEVEENFISIGKWKGKTEYGDRRMGKEEANSLRHGKETQEQNIEEMNKLIINLSKNLVKLELENKNHP